MFSDFITVQNESITWLFTHKGVSSLLKNNLNYKNINMFTREIKEAFRVTDQLVDISGSSRYQEPLHAGKLKWVVDFKVCVSWCCGGCCFLI